MFDLLNSLASLSNLENELVELELVLVFLLFKLSDAGVSEKEFFLESNRFIQSLAIFHLFI